MPSSFPISLVSTKYNSLVGQSDDIMLMFLHGHNHLLNMPVRIPSALIKFESRHLAADQHDCFGKKAADEMSKFRLEGPSRDVGLVPARDFEK